MCLTKIISKSFKLAKHLINYINIYYWEECIKRWTCNKIQSTFFVHLLSLTAAGKSKDKKIQKTAQLTKHPKIIIHNSQRWINTNHSLAFARWKRKFLGSLRSNKFWIRINTYSHRIFKKEFNCWDLWRPRTFSHKKLRIFTKCESQNPKKVVKRKTIVTRQISKFH